MDRVWRGKGWESDGERWIRPKSRVVGTVAIGSSNPNEVSAHRVRDMNQPLDPSSHSSWVRTRVWRERDREIRKRGGRRIPWRFHARREGSCTCLITRLQKAATLVARAAVATADVWIWPIFNVRVGELLIIRVVK